MAVIYNSSFWLTEAIKISFGLLHSTDDVCEVIYKDSSFKLVPVTTIVISKDNLKPYMEEGQTAQWPKEKGQTTIYKTLHRKLKIEQHERAKNRGELMYSEMMFLLHMWHPSRYC